MFISKMNARSIHHACAPVKRPFLEKIKRVDYPPCLGHNVFSHFNPGFFMKKNKSVLAMLVGGCAVVVCTGNLEAASASNPYVTVTSDTPVWTIL